MKPPSTKLVSWSVSRPFNAVTMTRTHSDDTDYDNYDNCSHQSHMEALPPVVFDVKVRQQNVQQGFHTLMKTLNEPSRQVDLSSRCSFDDTTRWSNFVFDFDALVLATISPIEAGKDTVPPQTTAHHTTDRYFKAKPVWIRKHMALKTMEPVVDASVELKKRGTRGTPRSSPHQSDWKPAISRCSFNLTLFVLESRCRQFELRRSKAVLSCFANVPWPQ